MAIDKNARTRASNRYNAKAYDRLNIIVKKGRKKEIQAFAESKGESLNRYINRLIDEDMGRE